MKIAIAGFGIEGNVNYSYWNTPENEVTIADERETLENLPEGAKTILGENAFSKLEDFDLVIRTAGLNPRKIKTGGKIWSATNEFFERASEKNVPIIGVTGTKGKGTTCSLIFEILKAAGKDVYLVGNIGAPALEILSKLTEDSIVVYELSSFQLWDAKRSPHIAVILGIEPDHLNVHNSMEDYVAAKANITRYQTAEDLLVYKYTNEISASIAKTSNAQQVAYPFAIEEFASHLKIPGPHNVENASAAVAVARHLQIDSASIMRGFSHFTGLPHRTRFIKEVDGVAYYDDSYSSAPSATLAAIESFDSPEILLIGGDEKGADFSALAKRIAENANFKQAIIYGRIRQRIYDEFIKNHVGDEKMTVMETTNFAEIITMAKSQAAPGDVVILSPGCASFDMFKNFADRGEQFIRIVESF